MNDDDIIYRVLIRVCTPPTGPAIPALARILKRLIRPDVNMLYHDYHDDHEDGKGDDSDDDDDHLGRQVGPICSW